MTTTFDHGRRPHGRLTPLAEGRCAFTPAPLPPPLMWDARLAVGLSEADRAIGRLAGEARRLPNANLFITPFVRKEAALSSRIEGTQTSLSELLAVEAGARATGDAADLGEVVNYVTTLEYALERIETLPLSLRLVGEMHERLMRGVRGDSARPGEFRDIQNWIGSPGDKIEDATYIPPPPSEVMPCLHAWESFLHDQALPPLAHVALVHAQFEAIHPFIDGNGRIGRMLITLQLVERGIIPSPLLYLSAYLEATREEYYARLRNVTERGEWEEWLLYFLHGVATQAEDVIVRIRRIDDLLAGWREQLAGSQSPYLTRALDAFAERPYWTIPRLAKFLGVAFGTAQRALKALEAAGIVSQAGETRRSRVYYCSEILKALE